jgi:hypothetical protein
MICGSRTQYCHWFGLLCQIRVSAGAVTRRALPTWHVLSACSASLVEQGAFRLCGVTDIRYECWTLCTTLDVYDLKAAYACRVTSMPVAVHEGVSALLRGHTVTKIWVTATHATLCVPWCSTSSRSQQKSMQSVCMVDSLHITPTIDFNHLQAMCLHSNLRSEFTARVHNKPSTSGLRSHLRFIKHSPCTTPIKS